MTEPQAVNDVNFTKGLIIELVAFGGAVLVVVFWDIFWKIKNLRSEIEWKVKHVRDEMEWRFKLLEGENKRLQEEVHRLHLNQIRRAS